MKIRVLLSPGILVWSIRSGVVLLILLQSCVTTKKTTYLQSYGVDNQIEVDSSVTDYKIQAGDNLFIRVTTPDPRWAQMFNTIPVSTATMSVGPQSVDLISYTVQNDGTIDLPFIGKVHVFGFSIPEVKFVLQDELDTYVSDAAITVKLVNNYVSVIGEVNRPGRYPIYKEQMNIFQAIAMAGDLGDYSNRYEVQIIRQKHDGTEVKEFDLTDKEILDSEFYYVLPNDVIYAKSMKGKFFQMNTFPYALLLSTISTTILLYSVITN